MLKPLPDRRLTLGALVILALPAVTVLWWPQFGDQALFQEGARRLVDGGVYWRDFWDVKQPGIFWFYALGERARAGVLGVRVLELVMVLLSGWVVLRICAGWGVRRGVHLMAPLLVLGPYVLAGDANGVGQVEGLLTLPLLTLYLAGQLAATSSATRSAVLWGVMAGLLTAVVAVFKLFYAPLAIVLLLAAWADGNSRRGGRGRARLVVAAWTAGMLVPALAMTVYVTAHDMVALVVYSTFRAPGEQLATGLISTAAAVSAVRALVLDVTVTGPPAMIALASAGRPRGALREWGLVAWVGVAAVLAAPQLPTTYRALILLPPIGLLAVLGLDRSWAWLETRTYRANWMKAAGVGVLLVLAAPLVAGAVRLGEAIVAHGSGRWSLADEQRLAIGDAMGGSPMIGPARLVRETVRPGAEIYVLGDPVVYRVLKSRQAIEMNGWGPEIMSARMWVETVRELRRSRPEWIFVQADYQRYIDAVPALGDLLSSAYTPMDTPGAGGRWWHTERPGAAAPSREGNLLERSPVITVTWS